MLQSKLRTYTRFEISLPNSYQINSTKILKYKLLSLHKNQTFSYFPSSISTSSKPTPLFYFQKPAERQFSTLHFHLQTDPRLGGSIFEERARIFEWWWQAKEEDASFRARIVAGRHTRIAKFKPAYTSQGVTKEVGRLVGRYKGSY